MPSRSRREVALLAAVSVVGTAAAAIWFALRPTHVLVGTTALPDLVPVHYQVSVFPAFFVLLSGVTADALRGQEWRACLPRIVLVAASALLAAVRLEGAIPLSGHAVFLSAMLAYELGTREADRTPLGWPLAAAGLLITAFYKLAVWHDYRFFAVSLGAGAGLGAILAWRRMKTSTVEDN